MHISLHGENSESYPNKKDELNAFVSALTFKDSVEGLHTKQKLLDFESDVSRMYIAADFNRENSYLWSHDNS